MISKVAAKSIVIKKREFQHGRGPSQMYNGTQRATVHIPNSLASSFLGKEFWIVFMQEFRQKLGRQIIHLRKFSTCYLVLDRLLNARLGQTLQKSNFRASFHFGFEFMQHQRTSVYPDLFLAILKWSSNGSKILLFSIQKYLIFNQYMDKASTYINLIA